MTWACGSENGTHKCNREIGHPGQHCHHRWELDGYRNYWWVVQAAADAEKEGS